MVLMFFLHFVTEMKVLLKNLYNIYDFMQCIQLQLQQNPKPKLPKIGVILMRLKKNEQCVILTSCCAVNTRKQRSAFFNLYWTHQNTAHFRQLGLQFLLLLQLNAFHARLQSHFREKYSTASESKSYNRSKFKYIQNVPNYIYV